MGVNGDVATLGNSSNFGGTQASVGYASAASATWLHMPTDYTVSASGMLRPSIYVSAGNILWRPYNYFINMAMAWDAVNDDLYVTRAYPWPLQTTAATYPMSPSSRQQVSIALYNSSQHDDQSVQGVPGHPYTPPNRTQVYKTHLANATTIHQGALANATWTLVADYGSGTGFEYDDPTNGIYHQPAPLTAAYQIDIGRDYGAASFMRDAHGNLVNGYNIFGAATFRSSLSMGFCQTTGTSGWC